MLLRFYLFSTVTGCSEPANNNYCDQAFAGIAAAEQSLFGQTFTDNWDEFYTTLPEEGEQEQLGIEQLPAFIVYDVERQQALFKLEGRQISKANVTAACISAWRLQPAPNDNSAYVTPSGETISAGELLQARPCPSWIPDFMCNGMGRRSWGALDSILLVLLLALLAFIVYKMVK